MQAPPGHTAPSLSDAPAWAREIYDELRRTRADVETLQQLVSSRFITRREVARMLGKSTRTIQRYERSGLLPRVPATDGGALYALDDVVKLKRMIT